MILNFLCSDLLLHEMASFDQSVEGFEKSMNEKLEKLSSKHHGELDELLRLKKSYKRLMKRNNVQYDEKKNSKKYKLSGGSAGFSNI